MPDWTHHLRQRLTHLDLDGGREAEIVEELSQHLDERYEELRRHGSSEAEACRVAMDELVDPDSLVEHMRPLRQAQTAIKLLLRRLVQIGAELCEGRQ